jgi:hypothetical protein
MSPLDSRVRRIRAWRASPGLRRVALLILLTLGVTAMLMNYVRFQAPGYEAGDVATRDLRAPMAFVYVDRAETNRRRESLEAEVPPVLAFDGARRKCAEARLQQRGSQGRPAATDPAVLEEFLHALDLNLDADHLETLALRGFDETTESLAREFIGVALRKHILGDRSEIPSGSRPLSIRRISAESETEYLLEDLAELETPESVRQQIALYALDRGKGAVGSEQARTAAAIARAAIRPNLTFNPAETEQRRQAVRAATPPITHEVKKGAVLFRGGDTLSERQIDMIAALQDQEDGGGLLPRLLPLLALCGLIFLTVYHFISTNIRRVARDTRNLEAAAFILLLVLGLVRLAAAGGAILFMETGGVIRPVGLGFIVPVAAGAMLVRILANGETALLFSVLAALLGGMMLEEHASFALFYLVSSIAAVARVGMARDRLQILRAGLQCAIVNGVMVLLIGAMHTGGTENFSLGRLLWEAVFGVCGGFLASFLVLGLVPFFELFGFVTNYKLVELASLNHPLLRSFMLKAPGSYHHSVVVGSLAEAAAEAVSANALLVRVASYFHDVGKLEHPEFFVENLQAQPNPHDNLDPMRSVEILHRHVRDGVREARKHGLPQPIIDIIWMHHGTSVVQYFYDKACRAAPAEAPPDVAAFRYPGPRPNTREAGIVHLADKVEAACRSLNPPSRDRIRETIQRILNHVVADGQLAICPLTLKEIYTIAGSFEDVLMGIHHQRIAYPERPLAGGADVVSTERQGVITLEIPNPLSEGANGRNRPVPHAPAGLGIRIPESDLEPPAEEERSGTVTMDMP